MKRIALQRLIAWKNKENRKPMIINGARQVGKTWLMEEFGKHHYKELLNINFERNSRISNLFETDLDPHRLLLGLELEFGRKIDALNTLIIFDEIQAQPKAITSLKYFYEEMPQYNIIAAGSLLVAIVALVKSFLSDRKVKKLDVLLKEKELQPQIMILL